MHEVGWQSPWVLHAWKSPDLSVPFHAGGFAWVVGTIFRPSGLEVSLALIRIVDECLRGPQVGPGGSRRLAEKGVVSPRMASRQVAAWLWVVHHLLVLRLVRTVVVAQPAANFGARWVNPRELLMGP